MMRPSPFAVALFLAAWPAATAVGQGVPETIVAEGVPEVPRDLAGKLAKYQNIRVAAFQDWLDDRREALILTRFADVPQVHRVAMPLGARSQLTFVPERIGGAKARPDHAEFVFSVDEGGAENFQLSLFQVATGDAVRFTDGRSRNMAPVWSNSGKLIAFSSNARNGKDMDIYVGDPLDPKSIRRLAEVKGSWAVADWSPDDKTIAAIKYVSINESYVHRIDVATGELVGEAPPPSPEKVSISNVKFSKDGKSLFWTTDRDSEFRHLARFDLESGLDTPIGPEATWDVEDFDISSDGACLAAVINEDGASRIRLLPLAKFQMAAEPKLPAGQVSGLTFRRGSHELGFTFTTAKAPADAYSYDIESGKLVRWTEGETGGLDTTAFVEPELIRYKSFDGREIPAFVYRPDPSKFPGPRPVLLDIHGGPESQFRPGFLGRTNYLINELGITLIFPNVRGSAGYGKSYLTLDNGKLREDSVKDIGALLDWVAKAPGLDAKRVGVVGGSYGGYMSLATMTHFGDRLKAGIDIVGISNFVSFLRNTQDYRRDLRRAEYGDEREPGMKALLETISPLSSAGKIRNPILIVQGKNDPRVPVTESEQMVAAVRKNGRPVWYVLGKNEGHGFAKKRNQDYLQAVEVLFLRKYLLEEDW
ncbi:MAG TPA: prolyl oligopeptidase family serine peptidase [Isosphaeraceae bacterium]|jgi:dipeptidyl aminopeptidase/acylaminoacyl peptidase|nr:prolyl oligopeptidase family serine peptidase [Isosphaeraceae bacterium]